MDTFDLIVNSFAQGVIDIDTCIKCLNKIDLREYKILNRIAFVVHQAFPNDETILFTIDNCSIKPTMTPCVLLKSVVNRKYKLQTALEKITILPQNESNKSLILLLNLFKNADTRRREVFCKEGCFHDWHNLNIKVILYLKT